MSDRIERHIWWMEYDGLHGQINLLEPEELRPPREENA